MKNIIIVSDFDGTITKEDTLYKFFKLYAQNSWLDIEAMWTEGKIGSMECLKKQFELVDNLDKQLIDEYISKVIIDEYFKEFINKKNADFIVVSDGVDYFIKEIFQKNNIDNIQVISNHGEFINNQFILSFPNQNKNCKNKSGTCKCLIVNNLKEKYKKIVYIGDGQSDFCVADKADIVFAKSSLLNYCKKNNIKHREFTSFRDIIDFFNKL